MGPKQIGIVQNLPGEILDTTTVRLSHRASKVVKSTVKSCRKPVRAFIESANRFARNLHLYIWQIIMSRLDHEIVVGKMISLVVIIDDHSRSSQSSSGGVPLFYITW